MTSPKGMRSWSWNTVERSHKAQSQVDNSLFLFSGPVVFWKEQPKWEYIRLSLDSTTLGRSVSSLAKREEVDIRGLHQPPRRWRSWVGFPKGADRESVIRCLKVQSSNYDFSLSGPSFLAHSLRAESRGWPTVLYWMVAEGWEKRFLGFFGSYQFPSTLINLLFFLFKRKVQREAASVIFRRGQLVKRFLCLKSHCGSSTPSRRKFKFLRMICLAQSGYPTLVKRTTSTTDH